MNSGGERETEIGREGGRREEGGGGRGNKRKGGEVRSVVASVTASNKHTLLFMSQHASGFGH